MIIRETPMDLDNYMLVTDSQLTLKLQEQDLFPMYIDLNGVYFAKTPQLELALNKIKGGTEWTI
jgi:hypothetical protein